MGQKVSKPWWGETQSVASYEAGGGNRNTSPPSEELLALSHLKMLEPELQAATLVESATLATAEGREKLRATIAEYGFAVVAGALEPDEVAQAAELWDADVAGVVEVEVPSEEEGGELPSREAAIERYKQHLSARFVSSQGLTQGRMAWFVRRHDSVRRVFEALHEGEGPLCVGTDSIFYSVNALDDGVDPSTLEDRLWPHIDLNKTIQPSGSWSTYQSIVYITPANERSQATVILPRGNSAEAHARYLADAPNMPNHFMPVRPQHFRRFADEARRIPVPAGGMVVWGCDTLHQGWSHGDRLAVPVCFEPASRRPADVLDDKRRAVREGLTTTHWASQGVVHGRRAPPTEIAPGVVVHHRAHAHAVLPDGSIDPTIDVLL